MNVISVERAARASSCEGGLEGEMLGLAVVAELRVELRLAGGAIVERGLGFVSGVRFVVLAREAE